MEWTKVELVYTGKPARTSFAICKNGKGFCLVIPYHIATGENADIFEAPGGFIGFNFYGKDRRIFSSGIGGRAKKLGIPAKFNSRINITKTVDVELIRDGDLWVLDLSQLEGS